MSFFTLALLSQLQMYDEGVKQMNSVLAINCAGAGLYCARTGLMQMTIGVGQVDGGPVPVSGTVTATQGASSDGGVSWGTHATVPTTTRDPVQECALTGAVNGKTCKPLFILGQRSQGWSSTSVLGDVAQYLDTSQPRLNAVDTGTTYYLRSSSTSDDEGGTGALTVRIVYLDSDGVQQVRTDTMNGTTGVSIGTGYKYFQWAEVATVGSNTVAVGNITISSNSGAPGVNEIVEYIAAGSNRSLSGRYKVPKDYDLYLTSWHVTASGTGTTMDTRLRSYVFADDGALSTALHFKDNAFVQTGAPHTVDMHYLKIPELAEILVSALPSGTPAGNRIDIGFDGVLIAQ